MNQFCSANANRLRVAVYVRVSTDEQTVENQFIELKQFCTARNFDMCRVYSDSGVSGSKESRPEFDLMLKHAHLRQFDCVVVWKLDRLSRSLKHLLNTLDTFSSLGIQFICYNDNIDTTTPSGRLMFQLIGAFAEFERALIRERVKLGLQRAKKQGKKLGRPRVKVNKYKVMQLRNQGMSIRAVARELEVSVGKVHELTMFK